MIIIPPIVTIIMLSKFEIQIIITCSENYNPSHVHYIIIRLKVNQNADLSTVLIALFTALLF